MYEGTETQLENAVLQSAKMNSRKLNRIMLVDDDEIHSNLCYELIQKSGIASDVTIFNDAEEALEYLETNKETASKPAGFYGLVGKRGSRKQFTKNQECPENPDISR